ncbi:hypothetical protein BGZ76_003814 [Entomortierella beljakovae]|nr:hypothetical protein BGZ76_003814 [Entomortierella beljakovae]
MVLAIAMFTAHAAPIGLEASAIETEASAAEIEASTAEAAAVHLEARGCYCPSPSCSGLTVYNPMEDNPDFAGFEDLRILPVH